MKIINLIAGPRNLSTALMYSFAQREDTQVLDEPFYAHYLTQNPEVAGKHPSSAEILATMKNNKRSIIADIDEIASKKHVFIKGMAHHYESDLPSFILNWDNVILIRHPEKLLASFSKVIENPTIEDIGIKRAATMFGYLVDHAKTPIVIDSDELLKNPSAYLQKICSLLDISFTTNMLSWQKGGISEDGIWAKHWYKNVHDSESFMVQKTSNQQMPERLQPVLDEALQHYNTLKNHILKND